MPKSRANWTFAVVVGLYMLYAAGFIYKTSTVINGTRYFTLFDDAMISMRYAKNIAAGAGPVWNVGGDHVEGFTNPLWTAYMAFWHLFNIPAPDISLAIQISGAALMVGTLFVVRRIVRHLSKSEWTAIGAVVLTAFSLHLNTWSLQGTEVSILALIISLSVWYTLVALTTHQFSILPYVILGIGTLVRIDVVVPLIALIVFGFFNDRSYRWRHVIVGLMVLAAFMIPQTAFRLWYYGDWLPNTYYLKMTGYPVLYRVLNGLHYAATYLGHVGILVVLVFFFRRDKGIRLLAWMFVVQMLYSIYVGADAWDAWSYGANRYVSIALPMLFILVAIGFRELLAVAAIGFRHLQGIQPSKPARIVASLVLVGMAFFSMNALYGPDAIGEVVLLNSNLNVGDNANMIRRALIVDSLTTPAARIAVVWAGITPYFSNRPSVDLLGKSDRQIAHMTARNQIAENNPYLELGLYYPGHMKWDYTYSIGKLRPDVVVDLWKVPWEADPYLKNDYVDVHISDFEFWLLKDSPNILWDQVKPSS